VATARGLEFEGEVRSRGGLELLGSYARQRAEDGEHARMPNSPGHMAKLRLSAPGPFDRSVAALEVQYLAARQTYLGTTVAGAAFAQATFSTRVTGSVDVVASIRNLFDTVYSDPASEEHAFPSIPQNGRTARIGLRWKLWTP
jgi:outer membrane receptor protein involved in Fe transport